MDVIFIILLILIIMLFYLVYLNNSNNQIKDNFNDLLAEYTAQQKILNKQMDRAKNKNEIDNLMKNKISLDKEINNYHCNKCEILGGLDNSCNICRITKRVEHDSFENESLAPNAKKQEPPKINIDIINNPNNMPFAVKSPTNQKVADISLINQNPKINTIINNNKTTKEAGHPHTTMGFADIDSIDAKPYANPVFYYDNLDTDLKKKTYFDGTPEIVNVYAPTFKYIIEGSQFAPAYSQT